MRCVVGLHPVLSPTQCVTLQSVISSSEPQLLTEDKMDNELNQGRQRPGSHTALSAPGPVATAEHRPWPQQTLETLEKEFEGDQRYAKVNSRAMRKDFMEKKESDRVIVAPQFAFSQVRHVIVSSTSRQTTHSNCWEMFANTGPWSHSRSADRVSKGSCRACVFSLVELPMRVLPPQHLVPPARVAGEQSKV